ncbi:insecticidal delta-endotoxin Cry8Ea1 family protein [Bacillus cereus]|nr:insecticidal delta-endotoxin Cry8Ea1 family protein [Bacillus cereus]
MDIIGSNYYNVLASPPARLDSTFDTFTKSLNDLKSGWEQFGETGYMGPLKDNFQIAWGLINGQPLDYLALTKASLSFIGLIPGAGPVVPFLNMFVGFIWPHLFGRPTTEADKFDEFFKLIMRAVKDLVNQEFEEFTVNDLNNTLIGMQTYLLDFQQKTQLAICHGDTPASSTLATTPISCEPTVERLNDVRVSFEDAYKYINAQLPHFKNPLDLNDPEFQQKFVLLTLPMYTTAATLNLVLCQGYIQFMEKYKNVSYDQIAMDQTKANMQSKIKEYSQTVHKTFTDYLPELDLTKKSSVDNYNRYVRSMTLHSLDIAAIWPTLDPVNYPLNASAKLDQTRVIFSDIAGPWEGGATANLNPNIIDVFSPLDDNAVGFKEHFDIRTASYSNMELQSVYFHTSDTGQGSSPRRCYSDGLALIYDAKSIVSPMSKNADYVNHVTQAPILFINAHTQNTSLIDNSLIELGVSNDKKTQATDSSTKTTYGAGCVLHADGNSNNIFLTNQKINVFYPVQSNTSPGNNADTYRKWGYISGHIPFDLVPQNTIGFQDKSGKPVSIVAGFPAEKGHLKLGDGPVNKVFEPINSAWAVKLTPRQELTLPIINQDPTTKYTIRVRYASSTNTQADININSSTGNILSYTSVPFRDTKAPDTENFPRMFIEGANGKYVLKRIADLIALPQDNNISIQIKNTGSADLILDRIEIIAVVDSNNNNPSPIPTCNGLNQITCNKAAQDCLHDPSNTAACLTHDTCDLCNLPTNPSQCDGLDSEVCNTALENCYDDPSDPKGCETLNTCDACGITTPFSYFVTLNDLQQITELVHELFDSRAYTALASTVSDYSIDQAAMKVGALSNKVFAIEKAALRKLVNKAKQLSKARNLLVGGNFENLDKWLLGRNVMRISGNDLFKGDHLLLPSPALYPSYSYQKVDESNLKPNTRYTISGFIGFSEHLQLVVSRYGKEVDTMLNVPYGEALPLSSNANANCCAPRPCQCPSCDGREPDPHFFSYSIDVGTLRVDANLGIEFGLRIVKPNGFATVSNLEIREDRPLTAQEIKKLQRKEQMWKKAFDKERAEITAILQPIINRINAFYKNGDWNSSILPHVTYQQLSDVVLPELPKLKHWFMEDREGEHNVIIKNFKQVIERVFTHLEEQNLIHNGSFADGLSSWVVDGGAIITNLGNGNLALQLSHWDSSVSQSIDISDFVEDKEYKLRVRGTGNGMITVSHGEEVEAMSFTTKTFISKERSFYLEDKSVFVQIQSEGNEFIVDSVEIIEIPEEDK